MLHCCHVVLCQEFLDRNRSVCWSIVVKEKPTVGSPFLEAFPNDRIRKVTIQRVRHKVSSCKLYQRIPVNCTSEVREGFEVTTYM